MRARLSVAPDPTGSKRWISGTETHLDDAVNIVVDFGLPRSGRGIDRGGRGDGSWSVVERGIEGGRVNARVHGVFTGRDGGCIGREGVRNEVSRCDGMVVDASGSLRWCKRVRARSERRVSGRNRVG